MLFSIKTPDDVGMRGLEPLEECRFPYMAGVVIFCFKKYKRFFIFLPLSESRSPFRYNEDFRCPSVEVREDNL